MKKVLFGVFFLSFLIPAVSFAQVKYLQITVKSAKLWPVKPSGRCWDPCLGKRFQLPARGAKNYTNYLTNKEFAKACQYSLAPDALVEIKIGKYEVFTTDKKNNTCTPNFNVGKTFRVPAGASFSVGVYDNDGAAGIQAKRDLMGIWTSPSVPAQLLKGGTLTLKSFGQVEELVLEAKVVTKPPTTGTCEGVYKVRIVEVDVHSTKANGKTWDNAWIGRFKKPDLDISVTIGGNKIRVPKMQDTLSAKIKNVHRTIAIKKGQAVQVKVEDRDSKLLDKRETVGETASADVCKLINASGVYTFSNFGRVKKLVVIFEKK